MISHGQNNFPSDPTHLNGRKLSRSERDQRRLLVEIRGVRYVNETASVQVLFQVSYSLPNEKYPTYGQLRIQGLRSKDPVVHMPVQALTAEVKEIAELGHFGCQSYMSSFLDTFRSKKESTKILTPYVSLEGHKAPVASSDSYWIFDNDLISIAKDLQPLCPSHIDLIAEFAFPPDLVKDRAPFYIVFKSDCKVTLMDPIRSVFRRALGNDYYQWEIRGQFHEDIVEEYIVKKKCGLRAALESQGHQYSTKQPVKPSNGQGHLMLPMVKVQVDVD